MSFVDPGIKAEAHTLIAWRRLQHWSRSLRIDGASYLPFEIGGETRVVSCDVQ